MKKLWLKKIIGIASLAFMICLMTGCDGDSSTVWVCGNSDDVTSVQFKNAPKYYYNAPGGAPVKTSKVNFEIPKGKIMVFDFDKVGNFEVSVKTKGVSKNINFKSDYDVGRFVILDPVKKDYIAILDLGSLYSSTKQTGPMPIQFLSEPALAHVYKINFSHIFLSQQKMPNTIYAKKGYKVPAYKVFFLDADLIKKYSKEELSVKLTAYAEKYN